jgi:hypothetical protein
MRWLDVCMYGGLFLALVSISIAIAVRLMRP